MNWHPTFKMLASGLAGVVLVSCTSAPRPAPTATPVRVWPAAPDEPRIAFVQDIRGPRDIGQGPSALHAMANWITGDKGESLDLRKPFAVALDENGSLVLADTDAKLVCLADFAHKKWRRFDQIGKTRFASPVAVARRNGVTYVADSELAKVIAFHDDGKMVF